VGRKKGFFRPIGNGIPENALFAGMSTLF